jgi:hypothetical protein
MTVKEVMERVPTTNSGYAFAYIDDALKEIQLLIEDNMAVGTLDLVKDNRFYPFPPEMEVMKSISIYDTDEEEYVEIQRIINVNTDDKDNA